MDWFKNMLQAAVDAELEKFREKLLVDITDLLTKSLKQAIDANVLRGQAYQYMDDILKEGQGISESKLDDWWEEKRASLKVWSGQ